MNHSTTEDKKRQVQKIPPIPIDFIIDNIVYRVQEGGRFTSTNYLEKRPGAGKGRGVSMEESKRACNLRKALRKLTGIIRANFGYDYEKEAHLTLTYHGKMTDKEKLRSDIREFIRLLRKTYSSHKFEYVAIMEPHGHGGWHIHMLLKSDRPIWMASQVTDYLKYEVTRELWRAAISGGGAVRHSRMYSDIKDFGAYFGAYFRTEISEDTELTGDRREIKEASKAAVKGSRLKFYPPDFKFYRTSRGIERPKPYKWKYDHAAMIEEYGPPYNVSAYTVTDEDGVVIQTIQTMDFKRKEVTK